MEKEGKGGIEENRRKGRGGEEDVRMSVESVSAFLSNMLPSPFLSPFPSFSHLSFFLSPFPLPSFLPSSLPKSDPGSLGGINMENVFHNGPHDGILSGGSFDFDDNGLHNGLLGDNDGLGG